MRVSTEDRIKLRELAKQSLSDRLFSDLVHNMVHSLLSKRSARWAREQQEAWVIAFFDTLQGEFMDVRNKVLADVRKGAQACAVEKPGAEPTSGSSASTPGR